MQHKKPFTDVVDLIREKSFAVVFVSAMAIAVGLILIPGPTLQAALLGLLNGNSLSLYEAANGPAVVAFPTLAQWLSETWTVVYLSLGAAVAVCTILARNPKKVFCWVVALAFCGLTSNDFITNWRAGILQLETSIEAGFANIVGAILLAVFVVSWNQVAQTISRRLSGAFARLMVGSVALIALGLLTSATIYYAADFVFRPLPMRIDAIAASPFNGGFAVRPEFISTENPAFTLFPEDLGKSVVEWSNPDGGIAGQWKSSNTTTKFDLMVEILSGCLENTWIDEKTKPSSPFELKNVKSIAVKFERGATDFWASSSDGAASKFALHTDPIAPFGIEQGVDAKTLKLWQFVNSNSVLTVRGSEDPLVFYLGKPLLSSGTDTLDQVATTAEMNIDGAVYTVTMLPSEPAKDEKVACRSIATAPAFQRGSVKLPGSTLAAGLRITLKATNLDGKNYRETSELSITGDSGWISANRVDPAALQNVADGVLTYFEAKGNVTIDLNGVPEDIRPTDRYVVSGVFRSRTTDDGKIRIYGNADAVTKNLVRKNPTKAEVARVLDLLSVLGPSLFVFGGTLLIPFKRSFSANEPFIWYAPSAREGKNGYRDPA